MSHTLPATVHEGSAVPSANGRALSTVIQDTLVGGIFFVPACPAGIIHALRSLTLRTHQIPFQTMHHTLRNIHRHKAKPINKLTLRETDSGRA